MVASTLFREYLPSGHTEVFGEISKQMTSTSHTRYEKIPFWYEDVMPKGSKVLLKFKVQRADVTECEVSIDMLNFRVIPDDEGYYGTAFVKSPYGTCALVIVKADSNKDIKSVDVKVYDSEVDMNNRDGEIPSSIEYWNVV